jgi:hypothetical protein
VALLLADSGGRPVAASLTPRPGILSFDFAQDKLCYALQNDNCINRPVAHLVIPGKVQPHPAAPLSF